MRVPSFKDALQNFAVFALAIMPLAQNLAQDFQRAFGTSLDNSFSKVIKDGGSYYVLGQDEPGNGLPGRATVTRLDANGLHQWTLSLDFASVWQDAVLTPGGDLLVVGSTLPFDQTSRSLMGRVTSSGGGNFSWLRTYDAMGRDGFTRIVKNPAPQNGSFPYYVLGTQNQPGGTATTDDVVLFNLDANGVFNWKKIYVNPGDDEFFRDLEALPTGELLIAGNQASGVVFKADNAGALLNGVQISTPQLIIRDVSRAASGVIYAAATTLANHAHIMKFDPNLLLLWDAEIPQLTAVNQIWEGLPGEIYATGRGIFGGLNRDVIVKMNAGGPSVLWVKYLDTGFSFTGGSSWWMPNNQIAFTDARVLAGGLGQNDAFFSVSDLNLITCEVSEALVDLVFNNLELNEPVLPPVNFEDFPTGTDIPPLALNWQQLEICSENPPDYPGVHCGQAVVTCFSGFNSPANYWSGVNLNAPVMALVDVRDHSTATAGTWWTQASATEYAHPTWTPQNLGQVFGVAIDNSNDMFVAASTIYTCNTTSPIVYSPFTTAGPGAIYQVDGATGAVSNYVTTGAFTPGGTTIPNNGSALGDIGYDATNNQFFVTNHADGMIYRVKNGLVMSRFDPFGSVNPPASGPGANPDFVALGERTWGVAYYNNRVYFATWKEDFGRQNPAASNEVWSIALDGAGEFQGTTFNSGGQKWEDGEVLEITLPCFPVSTIWSNPVSDIAFSYGGRMLLAERTMVTDCGGAFTTNWYGYAHSSRVLEYEFNGTFWDLTPGHTNPLCNTVTNLKFTTGAASTTYDNSAGGIDYGYGSFDPATTTQPDCDRFIWNTGDNLHPPTSYNTFCSQNGTTWLYGMQGTPATGGTNANSFLVDFDNNVCTHDKILLGDVEIFRCGCVEPPTEFPCDSLWVTKDSISFDPGVPSDTCCWDIDFHVHAGPLAYMEVESITPGVIFNNPTLSSSFIWSGAPTGTLLPIQWNPAGPIPNGDYPGALRFCLGNILTPAQDTQCVVFRWYIKGPDDVPYLACADTLKFYCPSPIFGDTCAMVKNDTVTCDPEKPLEYCYYFQVQNLSNFTAGQVVLSNPTPGFAFKPCPPPNISITSPTIALPNPPLVPGIQPDSCSPQLCVKIVATAPVLSPTLFCFELGLTSNDSCCHSAVEHCIVLEPCCDPCEDKAVTVHTEEPQDSCCHSLDITNDCNLNFFTKLELELLTPGVIFGSHFTGGPFPADWINPISTNTLIQWQHITGFVPNGSTPGLINFCLDEIDQPGETPQVVVLNWITLGSDGKDSIACSDTLIFDCPVVDHKCVDVLDQSIECKEDENGNFYYALTMTIQNVSTPPHSANELVFSQLSGPPVTIFPNPVLFSPLPYNGITTVSTFIFGSGLNPGDTLCFEIRLHDSFDPDNWCCFEGDTLCLIIPPCGDCACGDFTEMFIRWGNGPTQSQQVSCGGPPVTVGCPKPGAGYHFTGIFHCEGDECPDEYPMSWMLSGPGGTHSGSFTDNDQYFGINFPPGWFTQPGLYTLTLNAQCGGLVCPCVIQFFVECPDPCPCTPDVIQALSVAVNKGFVQALSTTSCQVCFSPKALSNCETVEWFLTNTSGSPIGTSTGNQSFCYTFPGSGNYTVIMVVTRKKADGSLCEVFTKSQTVHVTCLIWADCDDSVLGNPKFSENAIAGGLNSGGMSEGWDAALGEPVVLEGQPSGSFDGWTILLAGNLDTSDVLTTMEPICLEKGAGTVSLRIATDPIPGADFKVGRKPPGGTLSVELYQGSNFALNDCEDPACYRLANMVELLPLDSSGWVEVQIPYDLSDLVTIDSCGGSPNGVLVWPVVYVTNPLGNNQGGLSNRDIVQLDNFCFQGTIVSTDDHASGRGIRIFPNPTTGELMLEFSGATSQGGEVQILDLYGRLLSTEALLPGEWSHQLSIAALPGGVYFVKVTEEGRHSRVEKVVKQ